MFNVINLRLKRFLKSELMIMIVMLGMGLLLTFVFGLAFSDEYLPQIIVVDEDSSALSEAIIQGLEETGQFTLQIASLDEAQQKVEDGMALAVVYIKSGFNADILSGQYNDSLVLMKNNETMESWTLQSSLQDIANREASDELYVKGLYDATQNMGIVIEEQQLKDEMLSLRENPILTIGPEIVAIEDKSTLIHFILGFTLFFSTFTIAFAAADILQDKLNGTWNRLMITPTRRYGVLAAHLSVAMLVGMVQIGIMVLAGHYLFGVEWGDHIGAVLVLVFAFIMVVTCFGLFLAASLRTMEQLSGIVPVVLVSTAMLGGCMWPLDIINFKPMLYLAKITPQMWAMQGLTDLVSLNADVSAIVIPLLVLLGMAAFWFLLGLWKLNKNYN